MSRRTYTIAPSTRVSTTFDTSMLPSSVHSVTPSAIHVLPIAQHAQHIIHAPLAQSLYGSLNVHAAQEGANN
ncbi:hypothetical protein BDV93DRAFT_528675 [Ceratobasidium sp. AG-I]|nr:hypothetical protein BDV93DRAFT_528675 [Ceratobasidium sp. AG-I]